MGNTLINSVISPRLPENHSQNDGLRVLWRTIIPVTGWIPGLAEKKYLPANGKVLRFQGCKKHGCRRFTLIYCNLHLII